MTDWDESQEDTDKYCEYCHEMCEIHQEIDDDQETCKACIAELNGGDEE